MDLLDEIKKRMFAAMKAGNTTEKEILRVAVGEITTQVGRESRDLGVEEIRAILKKMVKSNRESLESAPAEQHPVLLQEIEILESFLPRNLEPKAIVDLLEPDRAAISSQKALGPAMGIAMKRLKASGASALAKDVEIAVESIRGGAS